jgi:hypothetical protein
MKVLSFELARMIGIDRATAFSSQEFTGLAGIRFGHLLGRLIKSRASGLHLGLRMHGRLVFDPYMFGFSAAQK